ncbi:TPA: ABC transporter permease, partial [Candidatus Geothermarchaeota archaeon]|nr:ABC transporter permease [Candidatus Geothermarchaeota archaeon]
YIGMFNGVLLLIEKKRSGLLKILLSSPIHGYTVLISDTLASIVSAIISASAILATGYLLGADYSVLTIDRIMIIFILTIIGLLFMIGLGLILSTLPKTYEGAQALANLIAFPLMFLGGIVIPEFLLPDYIKAFASIFPVSRLVSTMRNILVFDLPFSMIYLDMLYGAVATAIVFILGMYVYRRLLLRAVEHPT